MNIVIGKIGQKVIFNRESPEAIRSSTNGHSSAYALYNCLIDYLRNDTFYFIGDSDLKDSQYLKEHQNLKLKCSKNDKIDFGIFLLGVKDDSTKMCDIINNNDFSYIIVNEDIRCLNYFRDNIIGQKITRLPVSIIGCQNMRYSLGGCEYDIKYVPFERAMCYHTKPVRIHKKENMVVLANYSESYPRLEIVRSLIPKDVKVYGRLSPTSTYPDNFLGEVGYQDALHALSISKSTLLVPVSKGSTTTKYVEALLSNTLPVFYEDYGYQLLNIPKDLIIKNIFDFNRLYKRIKRNPLYVRCMVHKLTKKLIKPYYSGKLLCERILEEYKNEN